MLTYKQIVDINKVKFNKKAELSFEKSRSVILDYVNSNKNDQDLIKIVSLINLYHNGMRKGGVIPEIQHQYDIAVDLIKYKDKIEKANIDLHYLIKLGLLHDLYEDYRSESSVWKEESERLKGLPCVSKMILSNIIQDQILVEDSIVLSKFDRFKEKQKKEKKYYRGLNEKIETTIIKMLDRKNSLLTMNKVFKMDKQKRYIEQYYKLIMPLSKKFELNLEKLLFDKLTVDTKRLINKLDINKGKKPRMKI